MTRRAATAGVLAVLLASSSAAGAQAVPGDLDPTFGDGGVVGTIEGPARDEVVANDVAVQPDGKIVAVGARPAHRGRSSYLRRYNPDGTLDLAFSGDGQAGTFGQAKVVLVQPDGKIVVVGDYTDSLHAWSIITVTRFNPDGSLDTSFAGDGQARAKYIEAEYLAAALAPGGKIVVSYQGSTHAAGTRLALLRFRPDGQLDRSFSRDGKTLFGGRGAEQNYNGVAVGPDGKIITVTTGIPLGAGPSFFLVARYRASGALDKSFSRDGVARTRIGSYGGAGSVALQPDGKIVVGGTGPSSSLAVVRYTHRGALDRSFSRDGKTIIPVKGSDVLNAPSVVVTPGGGIVVGGGGEGGSAIAWLRSDGAVDPVFSGDGKTVFSRYQGSIGTLDLQPDCKVVQTIGYGNHGMILARFEGACGG